MHEQAENDRDALRGWGGLSPRYWAEALKLQEQRLVETHEALIEAPRDGDEFETAFRRVHIDAHFLLIALRHMLHSLDVCAKVLDEKQIKAISDDFKVRAPWLKDFRDVIEHLDAYTRGKGKLQQEGKLAPNAGPVIGFDPLAQPYEVIVHLGAKRLQLRAAAQGGSQLGLMLADAWEKRFGPERQLAVWGRGR